MNTNSLEAIAQLSLAYYFEQTGLADAAADARMLSTYLASLDPDAAAAQVVCCNRVLICAHCYEPLDVRAHCRNDR